MDFTVLIITSNGEDRLANVLEKLKLCIAYCLRTPKETKSFDWEVIVINHHSTDNTDKVIQQYQSNWSTDYPLKYYFVSEHNLNFARQEAVEKAQGKLIGFLPDDSLPAPDWVYTAYKFGQEHPKVGAYGSQIKGDFCTQKSQAKLSHNFQQIARFLALVERVDQAYHYDLGHQSLPLISGLVVRKQAWLQNVSPHLVADDKGEDLEALLHIQQAGWEIWYNPAMVIRQKIAHSCLPQEYLRLLVRCIALNKHRVQIKQKNQLGKVNQREDYLTKIHEAFEQGLFRLYYQQIRPVSEQEFSQEYGEILLRIEEKTGQLLLAKQFLPTAEHHNLMSLIDRLVIRKFLAQISQVRSSHFKSLYEINLSSASINDRNFINFLEQELSAHSITPEIICFSIAENIAIANLNQVIQLINSLKEMGCYLALDRVGRHPKYPDYLQHISVDYLKIDGNIVRNVAKNINQLQFKQINHWGQIRGIKTIAEYVENHATLLKIKTMGVDYLQGYQIGRIRPLSDKIST